MVKEERNIKESHKLTTSGFTLVELLAVIVILAIILVIAVPKVMSIIKDSKKATLETTAKMIASAAEKAKIQNQVLGSSKEITCESVAKINDADYDTCIIEFDGNTAKVTLVGKGKFDGLNVCNGTKTNASGVDVQCKEVCTANEVLTEIKQIGIKNKSTCNTYVTTKAAATPYGDLIIPLVEPLCNGEIVEGMKTEEAINYLIGMGLFTKEELIQNNVIEEKTNKYCKPNLPEKASTYVSRIYNDPASGLTEPIIKYTTEDNIEKKVNAGIRYAGANPNNRVYFNCEAKDSNNVEYGQANYDYASSCEVWRIIGVFNVQDGNGNTEKRIKIINTDSTFKASWDSSADGSIEGQTAVNNGWGINQWGESGSYEGADLMRLLNGYYIGKSGATCRYCNSYNQETCENICTEESLTSSKMKPLTSVAKNMITNAKWDTYAVVKHSLPTEAYLMEKGISSQYTGKSLCEGSGNANCNDTVNRTTSWTGLIGLMSLYDIYGANGWLYSPTIEGELLYPWSISPLASSAVANDVWDAFGGSSYCWNASGSRGVWPAVYLKSNIQIISGDGSEGNEYKLSA